MKNIWGPNVLLLFYLLTHFLLFEHIWNHQKLVWGDERLLKSLSDRKGGKIQYRTKISSLKKEVETTMEEEILKPKFSVSSMKIIEFTSKKE